MLSNRSARSIDNRLIGQLHELASPGRIEHGLDHEDTDHILDWVDPKRGSGRAAPAVLACWGKHAGSTRPPADGEGQAEAVAWRQQRVKHWQIAQRIRAHEVHGERAQQTLAIEFAPI